MGTIKARNSMDLTEAETPIFWPPDVKSWLIWKHPDAGKDWGQEEKGWGWDGWMATRTEWTWVWVDSGSWWWRGRLCMLQFMGLQRVGHNWATELNWNIVRLTCINTHTHTRTHVQTRLIINSVTVYSKTLLIFLFWWIIWLIIVECFSASLFW